MTTKHYVGGPLLGNRSFGVNQHDGNNIDVVSWHVLEPILTQPVAKKQRFVLLPRTNHVRVLASQTGQFVANLVLQNEGATATIQSVALAQVWRKPATKTAKELLQQDDNSSDDDEDDESSRETSQNESVNEPLSDHVVLVACSNGTIQEFSLNRTLFATSPKQSNHNGNVGPYHLVGPCHGPQRVFPLALKKKKTEQNYPLLHLTVPRLPTEQDADDSGVLVYALMDRGPTKHKDEATKQGESSKPKSSNVTHSMALIRIVIPPLEGNDVKKDTIPLTLDEEVQKVDQFKCRLKKGHNSFPFRLLSVACQPPGSVGSNKKQDIFVIVGRSTSISIHHERLSARKAETPTPVVFNMPPHNPLTALAISSTDLACGHGEGDVRILHDVFSAVLEYNQAVATRRKEDKPPPHPATRVVTRKLHWHAHAVTTLSYEDRSHNNNNDASILYSGGSESVLITWQLSRSTSKPTDMLPRIAKGSIVHVLHLDNVVLLYCQDNSLQALASHNRSTLWKIQGSPHRRRCFVGVASACSIMSGASRPNDGSSRNNVILLQGMDGSPGDLHWYHVGQERVVSKLEVVPYNFVSKTEHTDVDMPFPRVEHLSMDQSGNHLVTVDAVWSENAVGAAPYVLSSGKQKTTLGVVHALKFWTRQSTPSSSGTGASSLYLSASMTNPHGRGNTVTSMTMSCCGRFVATTSNDENAFRIWHKAQQQQDETWEKDVKIQPTTPWVCQYKITTPSGYSNFGTSPNGVTFSSDGSLLAIAYGYMVTLWDHEHATMLTTLRHLEDDDAPIVSVRFVNTPSVHDLLLTTSRHGVSLQSVFANQPQQPGCWSYGIFGQDQKNARVANVQVLPHHDAVAIAIYRQATKTSQIVLIDVVSGTPKESLGNGDEKEERKAMTWFINGYVRAMGTDADQLQPQETSAWTEVSATATEAPPPKKRMDPRIRLYVLTGDGEMLMLEEGTVSGQAFRDTGIVAGTKRRTMLSSTDAPLLNVGQKRPRTVTHISLNDDELFQNQQMAQSMFGSAASGENGPSASLATSDLPVLSTAFTRAFLGRNLVRSSNEAGDEVEMN